MALRHLLRWFLLTRLVAPLLGEENMSQQKENWSMVDE